jgi:hypothetical protein
MKKYFILGAIAVVVIVGLGYFLPHSAKNLGGTVETYPDWFYNGFSAGNATKTGVSGSNFSVNAQGQLTVNGIINNGTSTSTGNSVKTGNDTVIGSILGQTLGLNFGLGSTTSPTSTLSSSAGASIGSPIVASGHIVVETGQTFASASTTAIDSNSDVQVQLEQTTPITGVTCNTSLGASSTDATVVFASSTNTSLNGFQIKVAATPVTNPFCYSFSITN